MSVVDGQAVNAANTNAGFVGQEYFKPGISTTVTAGGSTTLTASSISYQQFTGTLSQIILLPVATTLTVGRDFVFLNRSTQNLTINYQDGSLCATLSPGLQKEIVLLSASTANGTWDLASTSADSFTGFLPKINGGSGQDNTNITFPTTGTLTTNAGTQSFTNKTFTDAITFTQIATPINPTSGTQKLYPKSDGSFYSLNNAGIEVKLGSGSGQGGINYCTNSDAETNTSGWSIYSEIDTVTITLASPGVFTNANTHGYAIGQALTFSTTGALPTGLTANTTYYVVSVPSSTTYTVSATLSGVAVNTSGTQSGTHTVYPVTPIAGVTFYQAPGLNLTRSTTNPLRGTASFLITQTNSTKVQGSGYNFAFTINSADQAKMIAVSLDYNADTNFTASSGQTSSDSDIEFYVYDVTNSALIPVSPKLITANGSNNYTYKGVFQSASNSTSYRLILHCATTNAKSTGWNFKFDNVSIGPQGPSAFGAPVTDPVSYSPNYIGFGSVTSSTATYTRIGKWLYGQFVFTSGTNTATTAKISLPSGLTIDSASISSNVEVGKVSASGTPFSGGLVYSSSDTSNLFFTSDSVTYFSGVNGTTWANTTTLGGSFMVPIAGWGSTTSLSQDYDGRIVAFEGSGATSAAVGATSAVTHSLIEQDSHSGWNSGTSDYTVPAAGTYRAKGQVSISAGSTPTINQYVGCQLQINGVTKRYFYAYVQNTSSNVLYAPVEWEGKLNSGDKIKMLADTNLTSPSLSTANAATFLQISKLPGNATVAASESVNVCYTDSSAAAIGTSASTYTYASKQFDSHGAYSSGVYTVPISGKYSVTASICTTAVTLTTGQILEIDIVQSGSTSRTQLQRTIGNGSSGNYGVNASGTFYCMAGDTLKIQVVASVATNALNDSRFNQLSIVRVGN